MKHYSFITDWYLAAPVKDVWQVIYQSLEWPQWWRDVKEVKETEPGDERGIGSLRIYTMRTAFLYSLQFSILATERVEYELIKGSADGDLVGTGSWHFRETDGITHVQCRWEVCTTVWWMNLLAFMLRPVFAYNHNIVMKRGGLSLARKLHTTLLK